MLGAGRLRWRIDILRAQVAAGAFNEDVETWTLAARRSACRQLVSDGERLRAQAVGAEISARFQVYSDTLTRALTPKDRIVCDGVVYAITGVKDLDRFEGRDMPPRRFREITCVARGEG
jgi:head-tail adaptor